MAFADLIQTNLANAFDTLGDLVVDAVFSNTTTSGYNYATRSADTTTAASATVKVLLGNRSRDTSTSGISLSLTARSQDINSFDIYDTVTIRDDVWKVSSYQANDYLIEAVLTRST